ncbi:MAG: hypothetical protein JWN75_206 [Candidatus Saccharibacteria bacterium]|nr:hypothetical protein [Candidatus Saccharibacteria bacterium]
MAGLGAGLDVMPKSLPDCEPIFSGLVRQLLLRLVPAYADDQHERQREDRDDSENTVHHHVITFHR